MNFGGEGIPIHEAAVVGFGHGEFTLVDPEGIFSFPQRHTVGIPIAIGFM
jgi:hypothetical protein